jgi:hypothetical protein
MFFSQAKPLQIILFLILINALFVNIFFALYIFYNYEIHPFFKKLTLYLFVPIWILLYMLSYSSARQYLVG